MKEFNHFTATISIPSSEGVYTFLTGTKSSDHVRKGSIERVRLALKYTPTILLCEWDWKAVQKLLNPNLHMIPVGKRQTVSYSYWDVNATEWMDQSKVGKIFEQWVQEPGIQYAEPIGGPRDIRKYIKLVAGFLEENGFQAHDSYTHLEIYTSRYLNMTYLRMQVYSNMPSRIRIPNHGDYPEHPQVYTKTIGHSTASGYLYGIVLDQNDVPITTDVSTPRHFVAFLREYFTNCL